MSNIEELTIIRDRYYNSNWDNMIRDYKIRSTQLRNSSGPKKLAELFDSDVKIIEKYNGACPDCGFTKYEKTCDCGKKAITFRLPKDLGREDIVKISNDESVPMAIRTIAKEFLFIMKDCKPE